MQRILACENSGVKTKKKKDLQHSRLPSFGAQVSLGGARRNLMVQISLLAHKFRGKGQKNSNNKRSSARNLRLSLRGHTCFFSWSEILLTLSGAAQVLFWGDTALKCTPVARGLLLSFGA